MTTETPSQDCPQCGRFVQDRPNRGLYCVCGWSKPRGGGMAYEVMRERTSPFPDHLDPDEYHHTVRGRLLAHHAGPRQALRHGFYGVETGDRITLRRAVWFVDEVERWPDGAGHTAVLVAETGPNAGRRQRWNAPWHATWRSDDGNAELLTSSHHPVCGDCGQPWPCREVDEGLAARQVVDALERRLKRETELPVECPAGCNDRFRTERGAAMHVARSRRHRAHKETLL